MAPSHFNADSFLWKVSIIRMLFSFAFADGHFDFLASPFKIAWPSLSPQCFGKLSTGIAPHSA
jgi:hypothetical protein